MLQLTNAPVLTRTIQLPNSGPTSNSGASVTTNIPVVRVIPQQQAQVSGAGFVAFVNTRDNSQTGPVNLTMTSRPVAPPAMAIPNFCSSDDL